MQTTFLCFSHNLNYALGWTVVHSLWQATVVALVSGILMIVLREKTAKVRYLLSNLALFMVLAASITTFCIYYDFTKDAGQVVFIPEVDNAVDAQLAAFTAPNTPISQYQNISADAPLSMAGLKAYFNRHIYLIVTIWVMGVALFMLRLLGSISYIYYLKSRLNFPVDEYWQELLDGLKTRVGVKRGIELLESAMVRSPIVIGHLKPVILFPIGAINRLNPNEVEAILAHELAHVLRNDYVFNIIQSVIEALFYFHPAVWWISAQIRNERENCCDDMAIQLCGNSMTYAKSLVSVQEMAYYSPQMAMAFAGKSNKNQLILRIQRVLNQPQTKTNVREKLAATCLLLLLIVTLSFRSSQLIRNGNGLFSDDLSENNVERTENTEGSNFLKFLNKNNEIDSMPLNYEIKDGIYNFSDNTQTVDLTVKDNSVVQFNINGLEVASADMPKFQKMINRIVMPQPPTTPEPPTEPSSYSLSSPQFPPSPMTPPTPPSPEGLHMQSNGNQLDVDENGLHLRGTDEHGKPINLSVDKNGFVMNGNNISINISGDEDTYQEDAKPVEGLKNYNKNGQLMTIVSKNGTIQNFDTKGDLISIFKPNGVVKNYKNRKLTTVIKNGKKQNFNYSYNTNDKTNNSTNDGDNCEDCWQDLQDNLAEFEGEIGDLLNSGNKDEHLKEWQKEVKNLQRKSKNENMPKNEINSINSELKSLQLKFKYLKKGCQDCDESNGYSPSYGTDEQSRRNAENMSIQARRNAEINNAHARRNAEINDAQVRRNAEIIDEQTRRNESKLRNSEQAKRDAEQRVRDREQAQRDREQAERDREQAQRDKEQAKRDATRGVAKDNLFRNLVKEGYLELNKKCTVKFDNDGLIVNGTALSDAIFKRYLADYETKLGRKSDFYMGFSGIITKVSDSGVNMTGRFSLSLSNND